MSRYYYEAMDVRGQKVPGVLDCDSEKRLIEILDAKGLTPIKVSLRPLGATERKKKKLKEGKVGPSERASFANQMARLMESSCPMDRALQLVSGIVVTERMNQTISDVLNDIQQGLSLHEAMARHPDVFGPLFLASVSAGEAGGFLADAFVKLAVFEKNQDRLRRKIIASLVYPLFMVMTVLVCLSVIFIFVLQPVPYVRSRILQKWSGVSDLCWCN